MATDLITDDELLALGVARDALASIDSSDRDVARLAACSLALSYLRKRYSLPLVSWSSDVKRAVAHLASYDLLSTRGFSPLNGSDSEIRNRYIDALDWLYKVARKILDPEAVIDSTPDREELTPLTASLPSLWTRGTNGRGRRF